MQNNLSLYKEQISLRQGAVDDLEDWNWISKDKGAFDGPIEDWRSSHKEAYTKYLKGKHLVIQAGGNCGMYKALGYQEAESSKMDTIYVFHEE